MREKIQNTFTCTCDDLDLTKITNIEVYVTQKDFYGEYIPTVISAHKMVVTIPFEDAKNIKRGTAEVQFAFVDENGIPDASQPETVPVNKLLKEAGYDPLQS